MSGFIDPAELYPMKMVPYNGDGGNGESITVSGCGTAQSVVGNGTLAGKTLGEVMAFYGRAFLGHKFENIKDFPLAVRIVEVTKRLDLCVFPDRFAAGNMGGAENTAMWYVLDAKSDSRIFCGLSGRATKLQLHEMLNTPGVERLLQSYAAIPGDAYCIYPGVIHSAGTGVVLLEISMAGGSSFVLSDWGRGEKKLQTEAGLKVMDFNNRISVKVGNSVGKVTFNRKHQIVSRSRFGEIWDLRLISAWREDTADSGSCHMLTPVSGSVAVVPGNSSEKLLLECGETAIVPANCGVYNIVPESDGGATVLKCVL